ncbi:MAG: MBL fold metallo-hydrolase, partial [Nitrososphaerales archaeon]
TTNTAYAAKSLNTHLSAVESMVKGLELTTIIENSTSMDKPKLTAQHGLSLLVKVDLDGSNKMTILFDTGPSSETVLYNIDAMNIDLSAVDLIFLSHGHYDHTSALLSVLKKIGKKIPIIAHPNIFKPKLRVEPHLKYIGLPFKQAEAEEAGGIMLLAKNPITLAKGVLTSGEIERNTPFEKTTNFHTIEEERFIEDNLPDDQALIIEVEGKGITVISGCAHSGIINTVKQAQRLTTIKEIHLVAGGFHLEKADNKQIDLTAEELQQLNPKLLAPCHCTGLNATCTLLKTFKERCKPLRTGDTLKI